MTYFLSHAICGAGLFLVFWYTGRRLFVPMRPAIAELGAAAVFETALGMVLWMGVLFLLAAVGALAPPLLRVGFITTLALAVLYLTRVALKWRRDRAGDGWRVLWSDELDVLDAALRGIPLRGR